MNKPMGMSSAQLIRDCQAVFNPSTVFKPMMDREKADRRAESASDRRRRSKAKQEVRVKMGHGGTLDPLATGILILGVGKATKLLQNFILCTKTYETVVLFGASTDTYDRVGRILKHRGYDHITREKVEEALGPFRGRFQQMPPLYSALKMNGKPLYEYAREGKPIPREIETREVEVSEMELVEWYEPGTHPHRWPTEEAGIAEKSLAERVWNVEQEQATGKKLTPEQEEEEDRAFAAHESFKQMAEERQDKLIFEKQRKRKVAELSSAGASGSSQSGGGPDKKPRKNEPMMSGALGELPPTQPKGRGSDLIPPPPSPDAPPPWEGEGPPACKIRMTVTSGFYVRSFCHDLGEKLGSAAMMAELARTRQGDYSLDGGRCLEYTDLAKGEEVWGPKLEGILTQYAKEHRPQAVDKRFKSHAGRDLDKPGKDTQAPVSDSKSSQKEDEVLPTPKEEKEGHDQEWAGFPDPDQAPDHNPDPLSEEAKEKRDSEALKEPVMA